MERGKRKEEREGGERAEKRGQRGEKKKIKNKQLCILSGYELSVVRFLGRNLLCSRTLVLGPCQRNREAVCLGSPWGSCWLVQGLHHIDFCIDNALIISLLDLCIPPSVYVSLLFSTSSISSPPSPLLHLPSPIPPSQCHLFYLVGSQSHMHSQKAVWYFVSLAHEHTHTHA